MVGINLLFCSVLPDVFGPMSELFSLQLQNNRISGSIPASVFGPQLRLLWLQLNNFTGAIPESVSNSSIRECYLANNKLSGEIPAFPNTTLMLDLGENMFSGTIDRLLSDLPFLYSLNLRSNRLRGALPRAIFKCTYLTILILDDNQVCYFALFDASLSNLKKLTSLPPDVSGLTSALEISLKNNQLSGTMPYWLLNTPTRTYLDVSNNSLTGPSPLLTGANSLLLL